jgi:DHA1 family inner membrane transport protein
LARQPVAGAGETEPAIIGQALPGARRCYRRPVPPLLLLFSAVNLVIGTAAFAVTGILAPIAEGLGVGVPAAGQAMTVYALATALLAPWVLLATGRWRRRSVLLLALGLFTAGALVSAVAGSLAVFLAGRVLMGVGAVFTPVAAGIAIALVNPARRGKALALVFLGMSLAYVVGLPIVSWVGLRWGWRAALGMNAALALLAWALIAWKVPREIAAPGASFAGIGGVLRRPAVLAVLLLTLAYFTAIFGVFSYIGPVLKALVPMSGEWLSLTLSLFGVAGVLGTLSGGAANDRFGPWRTLWAQLLLLGAMMALLPLTAGHWGWMVLVMMVWGIAGFGMMAPQQSRLAGLAPREAPLLLSLNTSMLYFGTALGAALGGLAAPVLGFARLSWLGVLAVALAVLILATATWIDRGERRAVLAKAAAGRT